MELQFSDYSIRRRLRDTIGQAFLKMFASVNLPAFVRPIDYCDRVTGNRIKVRNTLRYTIISVNNRDYWFRRISGKFDGPGYGCSGSNCETVDCTVVDILESTASPSVWGRLKRLIPSIG